MLRLALSLLVLVLALAGCGGEEEAATPATVTETVTETIPATTEPPATTAEPAAGGGECSTSGLRIALTEDPALPAAVADTRRRIVDAAVACDYDALQELALEGDSGFTFSYGAETSAADHWAGAEERGEDVLRILVQTLAQTGHEYQGNWVWPTAYSDAPSEADWEALTQIYPADDVRSWREQGAFYGYRVGITPAGEWLFFVAGD